MPLYIHYQEKDDVDKKGNVLIAAGTIVSFQEAPSDDVKDEIPDGCAHLVIEKPEVPVAFIDGNKQPYTVMKYPDLTGAKVVAGELVLRG